MQPITWETVKRLADLARIEMTESEYEALAEDLSALVTLAMQMPPLSSDAELRSACAFSELREDCVKQGLHRETILSQSRGHDAETFLVPRTVEE